jgi:chromosome segregation ATPase
MDELYEQLKKEIDAQLSHIDSLNHRELEIAGRERQLQEKQVSFRADYTAYAKNLEELKSQQAYLEKQTQLWKGTEERLSTFRDELVSKEAILNKKEQKVDAAKEQIAALDQREADLDQREKVLKKSYEGLKVQREDLILQQERNRKQAEKLQAIADSLQP